MGNDLTAKITELKRRSLEATNAAGEIIEQGSWYYIFPYRIHTGLTNYTTFGFTTQNASPNDFITFERLVSGNELVIATWKGAVTVKTKLKDDGTVDEDARYLIREYHPDKAQYWKGYINEDDSQLEFNQTQFGDGFGTFITEQTSRTVTLQVRFRLSNDELLRISRNELYDLYLIPQFTNTGESTLGSSLEWMYISDAKLYNDHEAHEVYTEITFTSLNDKLSGSGRSISTFVTPAQSVGDGYAIPKINYDKEGKAMSFEMDFFSLRAPGCQYIQLSTTGPTAFTAPLIYGRPKDYNNFIENKIYAPRRLFAYKMRQPVPSKINAKSGATSSFYLTKYVNEIATYYENWYIRRDSNKTPSVDKKYDGYLSTDYKKTTESNTENFFLSDNNWIFSGDVNKILDSEIDVRGASGFNYINKDSGGNDQYIGLKSINLKNLPDVERIIPNIMFILSLAYSWINEIPMTITQTVAWSLKDIPLIGGFLNKITLGLVPSWNGQTNHTNVNYPTFNGIYALISPDYYEWFTKVFWKVSGGAEVGDNAGLLPYDMFSTDQNSKVSGILDATSQSTAIAFQLTDKVMLYKLDLVTGSLETDPTACSSIMIGQIIYADDGETPTYMYIVTDKSWVLPPNYRNQDGSPVVGHDGSNTNEYGGNGYLIDYIGAYTLTDSTIEINAFSKDFYQYDPTEITVFNSVIKASSSYVNNKRDWLSGIKTSFLTELKTDDYTFKFPGDNFMPYPLRKNVVDVTIDLLPHSDTGLFARNGSEYTHNGVNGDTQTGQDHQKSGGYLTSFSGLINDIGSIKKLTNGSCENWNEMKADFERVNISFVTKNGGLYYQEAKSTLDVNGAGHVNIRDSDFGNYNQITLEKTFVMEQMPDQGVETDFLIEEIVNKSLSANVSGHELKSTIKSKITLSLFASTTMLLFCKIEHSWENKQESFGSIHTGISTLISGIHIEFIARK